VYRQVLLANANPVLSISDDLCTDIFYQIAEDEQLDFEWSPTIHNIKQADKWITIWGEANTKNLSSIPTEKISRVALAQERINRIFTARTCGYGQKYFMPRVGTQFPCHASAQDAEMSLAQYEDFVYLAAKIGVNDPIKEWEQRREMAKTPNKKII
jgi:aminopeptidase